MKKEQKTRKRFLLLGATGVGFLLAILLLGFVEGILWAFDYTYSQIPRDVIISFTDTVVQDMNKRKGQQVFIHDPTLFWRLNPGARFGTQLVNELGYIGPPPPADVDERALSVLCLGDSCTALGLSPYPERLNSALHHAGLSDAYVFNAGIPGYTSLQGYRLSQMLTSHYSFDVATIYYGWNDHWEAIRHPDIMIIPPSGFVGSLQSLGRNLRFYQFFLSLLKGGKGKTAAGDFETKKVRRVSADEYRVNITNIIRLCRNNHIVPMLITAPMKEERIDNPLNARAKTILLHSQDEIQYHKEYTEIVRHLAQSFHVPLLDCEQDFAQNSEPFLLMDDGIHLGPTGAQRVSETILNALLELQFITKKQHLFAQSRKQFTSLKPNVMKATFTIEPDSLQTDKNTPVNVNITVTNVGDTVWNITSPYAFGLVRCGIQLFDEKMELIQRDFGRISLPDDCYPGNTITFPATIVAPEEYGTYYLVFDMVNEGVGWLQKWGSQPAKIPLSVIEKRD